MVDLWPINMMRSKFFIIIVVSFLFVQVLDAQFKGYETTIYDESKVAGYTLPELLKTSAGETVSTTEMWETVRRPEILKLFEDNVYGQVPDYFDNIQFKIKKSDTLAMSGKATLKVVEITVNRNQKKVSINLLMFIPNQVKKPVPVFLLINHRGIKTMDVTRQNKDDFWPAEMLINAGYAIAGFDVLDFAPDNKDTFTRGVLEQLYPEQLTMSNGMRALGAWSWGASRAIDYFETDKSLDVKKIIVVGHSRSGKAALWCGAQDQRVAITIANNSGNSGAALTRRKFGETVERITSGFPYWFCPNYLQFANNEDELPVDQHMLLGLIAPRSFYIATAAEDLWSDPKGQYLALREVHPVYRLYGLNTKLPLKMPDVNKQIIRTAVGYHKREGIHNLTPYDWQQFIRFANKRFKSK
jgi:hypothetical protein